MNFREEKRLFKKGYKILIGVDEAGRGPLAGPVVVAAVCFCSPPVPIGNFLQRLTERPTGRIKKYQDLVVGDSKKLSPRQRELWYQIFASDPNFCFTTASVSAKVIDKINIAQATNLAAKRTIQKLLNKPNCKLEYMPKLARFVLLDKGIKISTKKYPSQKSIIKGDEKVFLIAAASIIAKITRDRIMESLHKKYPQYGFDKHKGYGTKKHLRALRKYGPCLVHRQTFNLVHRQTFKSLILKKHPFKNDCYLSCR